MSSAEESGRKLGVLIASLDVSDQEREALLSLLPKMTEEQLQELTNVLEAKYLEAATKKEDQQLVNDLKTVEEKYDQAEEDLNTKTNEELDSIA